ncbi:45 kDa calcium-binding protein [Anastrepha ludens]|uniref:45 kDa calcium-binding protein n=1 Tax=Anastrepha ludens TaxID=28586 RepID=UPI0023AE775F|nr:45 kDa calcium-binding protein [Anastrepha ludens]XP_053955911.1 45 kDa calcium-binding protein [Anastrepha ludens]XP_053955920.1 45 kDa calcium-binding protein [Anastrepha ludens]XP_053955925.1 45 kDa calcium-binding protein [Anastrepha ludens]XP_053955935.1 45 kDa calcium-binding protein [Anastrepha ludens]XP_053955942.1 45 kDa calcium-binding protein [Anastrepha ludens]
MSPLVSKLSKTFRWLRWSTICAILFYMFFIGLILHSTTYKLQYALKSEGSSGTTLQRGKSSEQHLQQQTEEYLYKYPMEAEVENENQQQQSKPAKEMLLLRHHQEGKVATESESKSEKMAMAAAAVVMLEQSSAANGNNVLNTPPEAGPATTVRQQNDEGDDNAGAGGVGTVVSNSAAVAVDRSGTRQRGGKSSEPETVILAASSVNEKQILEKAFKRADRDHNSELSIQELAVYINQRIIDHIEEAIQNNPREFQHVDVAPADGLITWEEYHHFFLKEHGMTDADIDEHNEIKHTALNRKAREDMMRDKARWSEAARTDLFSLTIDEYLSFRHPESSISNLLELVDDLLRQFDQDGDDQLTIEEFSEVNVDDDEDLRRKSLISQTVVERREEFKRIIDKNNDGKADREELLNYVNPKTPRYALQEAATLFSLCDENKDGRLTLNELTENAEIFLTSKMMDAANSFHTEF